MARPIRTIDQFAELLSEHVHQLDIDEGRELRLDPGGNAGRCALKLGLSYSSGNGLLQRIRRELGPQAR